MAVTAEIDGKGYFRVNDPGVRDLFIKIAASETAAEGGIVTVAVADSTTHTVDFGGIGTGAAWFGYVAGDEVTLKVNGQSTGVLCDFALFRSTDADQITSATIANATGSAVTVHIILAGA